MLQVKLRVLVEYMKAQGPASIGLILSAFTVAGATVGTNIWLSAWSDDQVSKAHAQLAHML